MRPGAACGIMSRPSIHGHRGLRLQLIPTISLAFTLEDSDIRETVQPYVMARIVDFAAFIMSYNFAEASSAMP